MGIATLQFYHPWPVFGTKLSSQWDESRTNTSSLAALVRAAYVDVSGTVGEDDLSGWAIGELDFRNRFRTFYRKSAVSTDGEFVIQINTGTESAPVWVDCINIRRNDQRVVISSGGGLEVDGGFYNNTVNQPLAESMSFSSSAEWTFNHNLGTTPVLWDTFDGRYQSLTPNRVDVSDPNTAYFYWGTTAQAGTAIVSGAQAAPAVRIKDTLANGFNKRTSTVAFDSTYFYGEVGGPGNPVIISLKPGALGTGSGGVTDHGALTGLTDDDHTQYTLADGTRAFTGDQSMGSNRLTNLAAPVSDNDAARKVDLTSGGGFYGIVVGQDDDAAIFNGVKVVKFETANFYVGQNAPNTDEVTVSFRGQSGSGVTDHGALSGLADDDHTQYTLAAGTRAFTGAQSMGGNRLTNVGAPTANTDAARLQDIGPGFYGIVVGQDDDVAIFSGIRVVKFETANFYVGQNAPNTDEVTVSFRGTAGGGGGVTDHGALTGLADDDHTQYTLADGTRAFSGNQSMGSNRLTNLGAPTADTDAARLQDIGPGFYGLIIEETEAGGTIYSGVKTLRIDTGAGFYVLSSTSRPNDPILSIAKGKSLVEAITVHIEDPVPKDYILDEAAIFGYTVLDVHGRTNNGSANVGFYINNTSITSLDPVTFNTSRLDTGATGNNTVTESDRFRMSVFSSSSAEDLALTIKIKRS